MKKDAIKLKLIGYLQKNIVMSEGSKLLEQFEMEAKKEVFDDIIKLHKKINGNTIGGVAIPNIAFIKLMQRHLSTSKAKELNSSSKKDCPKCGKQMIRITDENNNTYFQCECGYNTKSSPS